MQNKLANLKTFMNEFDEMKKDGETCELDEEECDQEVEQEELIRSNSAKKELIEIHKQKLINAKEKLKDLQSLISRLQAISDETGIGADFGLAEDKIDQETFSSIKKAEIEQKEKKLEELNRNKQKILELLSQKEQEAAVERKNLIKTSSSTNDVSYLNEIESKFKAAENGFDMLSIENLQADTEPCHSPSDILWSKMRKQLAMRENLRSQKNQLEECIRDEFSKQEPKKSKKLESKNEEGNEILSAYRGFLMRGTELDRKSDGEHDKDNSLISEQNSVMDRKKSRSESTMSQWDDNDQESTISEPKQSNNFEEMNDKLEQVLLNQQKMNEQIYNKFNQLFEKKSLEQSNQNNQSQFQTQLHIQQLMFNLNTAYHEISTQRSEISRLNEQMSSVNKQLIELNRTKNASISVGINTELAEMNEPSRASLIAALPSYFYNRKKMNANAMEKNDYTDDFEELDDEEEKKDTKASEIRAESSVRSTTDAAQSSMSSSSLSLRKSLMKHRNAQTSAVYKSLTFEKMREKIYSEVANLISQNESRPFYLLNLFKELQFIKDKNARDQTLKSIFNISNRQSSLKINSFKKKYSNMNQESDYANKQQDSDKQNEADEESTPFESDSLSNTVIFVKNSPKNQVDQKISNSSGSSIMGVEDESNYKQNIGADVKKLISKIISSVKNSESFDSDEDSSNGSKERYESKRALFNSNYLNEIIEKVHQVLSESAKHCDYLNYYSAQLTSYLKEALAKYEKKNLADCMEDVLIDISDILYNELTFYSTLKERNKIESYSTSSSSMDSSGVEFSDQIEQTEDNFKKCKYQSVELLKRLNSILNNKFGDLKTMKDRLMDDKLAVEKSKLEDLKFNLEKEFENLTLLADRKDLSKKYGPSAIKYFNSSEPDSSVCGDDNFQCFEADCDNELPYKVVDADELKDNTITVDELFGENNKNEVDSSQPDLDQMIMESICDQLVGNADEIIKIQQSDGDQRKKTNEENGSLKSDSSNSDHFVIITESKKSNENLDKNDDPACNEHVTCNHLEANNQFDEQKKFDQNTQ